MDSTSTQTITVLVEPAPVNPQNIEDISMLWGLFLVAAVVIFCARRLVDLFRIDSDS